MKSDQDWIDEWNELHIKYVAEQYKDGIEGTSDCGKYRTINPQPDKVGYRNRKMADYCEEIILKAKEAYYKGNAIMSDSAFDRIENILKVLRPDSKVLKQVGYGSKE